MANSEKYHVDLVGGKGTASKKSMKSGAGMGRHKAAKGSKSKAKTGKAPVKPGKKGGR